MPKKFAIQNFRHFLLIPKIYSFPFARVAPGFFYDPEGLEHCVTYHVQVGYTSVTYHDMSGTDRVQIGYRLVTYQVQITYRSVTYHVQIGYTSVTYHDMSGTDRLHIMYRSGTPRYIAVHR